MSILVTGAAGFIGCNNVIALNRRGITDVIAVDNLEKATNLRIWLSAKFQTILINATSSSGYEPVLHRARTRFSIREPVPTPWKLTAAT